MPIVGILAVHLAGHGGQEMLEGPKAVLDPMAPLPGPDEPRPADGCVETHDVVLLFPGLLHHDEGHGAICRTLRPQPYITHPRDLGAVTPGPLAVLLQVMALDLAPIGQCEGIGTLPFHEECALVRRGYVAHELRIAKPAIRYDHRRWQGHTASAERRHASIQHALHPVQFVTARRSRAGGVRPPDGKVDGHHELAIADDDEEQHPINPGEHPVFLAAPPGAHQAQLLTVLFEYRVIAHPGPLPAATRGRTRAGGMAP